MRKLMYMAIGFGAACGASAYGGASVLKYPAAGVMVLILCLIGERENLWKKLVLESMSCVLGFFWYGQFHSIYLSPVMPMDGQVVTLTIRASDFGEPDRGFTFFDGTLEAESKTYLVHTRLDGDVQVVPGMAFTGEFYVSVQAGGTYSTGKGSFLYAYQKEELTITQTEEVWTDRLAALRHEIRGILKLLFPEDAYPFAKALFLGDSSELGYKVDTDLKVSGIRHVVAVSGLHVSILFGLLSTITFRRRFAMALAGYPVLFFFCALTGFTPSVMRACLMCSLLLLGRLVDREYDGPTSLSFAVLVMLAANPLVITTVSFQLSVASVAGIFLFHRPIVLWMRSFFEDIKGKNLRARLIRWLTGSVSVTLSAISLTTPLCAYYFGMVSLMGVLTNLLTLWVVSGIFYGIMAVSLIYTVLPTAAVVLGQWLSWPIRYVLGISSVLAKFPLAAVYTSSPYIIAWLVFVYSLLLFFLIIRKKSPMVLSCCAVIGLCMALMAEWTEPMLEDVRLTVLDVGQGQCLVLQSEGRSFVVDCGGDYDAEAADQAAELLLRQGIQKLDGLILTHLDRDHSGGAEGLLQRMKTELLILPPRHSTLPEYTDAETIWAEKDLEITYGNTKIRIFTPTFPGTDNENSLCVLFDTEKCDILITGDRDGYGERSLLRSADIPDVDILIAGHHGSGNSTCEELLTAVKPEIVCISAGAGNPYGHPAPGLMERLTEHGCSVYRTDLQGTITIRR